MENKKIFVIGIALILLIGIVSAQGETNYPSDNLIGRIISSIQYALKGNSFTVYGNNMGCGVNGQPQKETYWQKSQLLEGPGLGWTDYSFSDEQTCDGNSFMVNFFRGKSSSENFQYLSEYYYYKGTVYVTDGIGKGGIYTQQYSGKTALRCDAGNYWNNYCFVQIYCCAQGACESTTDCSSSKPLCSKTESLSLLFPQLGVCQPSIAPTRQVKVYTCNSVGTATFLKNISSTDTTYSFCDEGKNNYLRVGGTSSGVCYTEAEGCGGGTGSGKKSLSLTSDEWGKSSPQAIVASMCKTGSDCIERGNYTVSCDYSDTIKQTNINSFQLVGESQGGITGLCFTIQDSFIGKIGNWFNQYCAFDSITNPELYGTCRASPVTNFFATFAFFSITGDNNTDGMIIFFGGILLIFLLFSMMGGKR